MAACAVVFYCNSHINVTSLIYIPSFQGFTDDQLMLVEQNTVMVEEREREIRQVVQSISDLNEIFRDLAGMVVEQVFTAALMSLHTNNYLCQGGHVFRAFVLDVGSICSFG